MNEEKSIRWPTLRLAHFGRIGTPIDTRLLWDVQDDGLMEIVVPLRRWLRAYTGGNSHMLGTGDWSATESSIDEMCFSYLRAWEDLSYEEMVKALAEAQKSYDGDGVPNPGYVRKIALERRGGGSANPRASVIKLLEKKGWSQGDWANHSKVDFKTVRDYLRGIRNPTRFTRKQLADSLGIAPDLLPK